MSCADEIRFSVRLKPGLQKALTAYSVQSDKSCKHIVHEALAEHLEKNGIDVPKEDGFFRKRRVYTSQRPGRKKAPQPGGIAVE